MNDLLQKDHVAPDSANQYINLRLISCIKCITLRYLHTLGITHSGNVVPTVELTSGGMCPVCVWPVVISCLAWGMEPIWKLSGPPAPGRMITGRATLPVSTLSTLLNCCCSTVDLKAVHTRTLAMMYFLAVMGFKYTNPV